MNANFRSLWVWAGVGSLMLAWCLPASGQTTSANASQKEAVLIRHTEFGIPFQVAAPAETPEVQLMVSNDRGANWVPYQRQSSRQSRFVFSAQADGEYWFAIRTFDTAGRPTENSPVWQPELKVAIDTTTPVVSLHVEALESGEVIARWSVRDPAIDPQGIHLSYQASPQSPFQQVKLDVDQAHRADGVISGETRWFPFATERLMLVRIDAYDKAGNVGVAQQTLSLPLVATRPRWNQVPRQVPGQPGGDPNSMTAGNVPVDPFQRHRPAPAPPSQAIPWPTDNAMTAPATRPTPPAEGSPQVAQQPSWTAADEPQDRFRAASMKMEPPVASSTPTAEAPPSPRSASAVGLPPGVRPQFINHKAFALNYGVETVGPSGIGQVELWVTRDAGQTWEPGGIDPDRESPFDVEVQAEGLYGFRIVVEGGNGLSGRRPQPGDLADIWVNVDLTKPIATITNVVYGEGPHVGHLDIQWSCSDAHLAQRPVSLYYAASPDGPWNPIAEEIANSGRYVWKITPEVPADIYLRITATDEAGNVGEMVLRRAIANDGLVPRAQIRSINPLSPVQEEARLPVTLR